MKFKKATATGLLLVGLGNTSLAAPPPLDRPTPPPCCADGRCYANPLTFGVYETRWRRWPIESMEPTRGGPTLPIQPQADIPSFQAPPAEEEDRKAPPPTMPREEPVKTPTSEPQQEPGGPGGQSEPEGSGPAAAPTTTPGEPNDQNGLRRTLPPLEPQSPATQPFNINGPTSESDPPPALPFGPRSISAPPQIREARQAPAIPVRRPAPTTSAVPTDDPPPGLPTSLAALSN